MSVLQFGVGIMVELGHCFWILVYCVKPKGTPLADASGVKIDVLSGADHLQCDIKGLFLIRLDMWGDAVPFDTA